MNNFQLIELSSKFCWFDISTNCQFFILSTTFNQMFSVRVCQLKFTQIKDHPPCNSIENTNPYYTCKGRKTEYIIKVFFPTWDWLLVLQVITVYKISTLLVFSTALARELVKVNKVPEGASKLVLRILSSLDSQHGFHWWECGPILR